MSNIGILHISDIHASVKSKKKIAELYNALKTDIKKLQNKHDTKIEVVCITGDLINEGDNAEEELDVVFDTLIVPLMKDFSLKEKQVFIVPGNHEVMLSKVVPYIENGISMSLTNEESINSFIENIDSTALDRISYFDEFSLMFGGEPIYKNALTHSHIISW